MTTTLLKIVVAGVVWILVATSCKENREEKADPLHTDKTFTNEGITDDSTDTLYPEPDPTLEVKDSVDAQKRKETPPAY